MEPKNDNFMNCINHPSSSSSASRTDAAAVHLYRNPNSNPNQFLHLKTHEEEEEDRNPDPDPEHITNGGASKSKKTSSPTAAQPPQMTQPPPDERNYTAVRYRECLKNHAASMGTRVVDGCGEFMPNGEEGTPEALKCAACDCHRNFHRKEENGVVYPLAILPPPPPPPPHPTRHSLFTMPPPPPPHLHHHHRKNGPSTPVMMNFSVYGGGGTAAESSSEDLKTSLNKKRFRTKFTQEQKEKMHDFAEKIGWRFQKQDEQELQHFCNEVGIKRQVLKVWMHNNKQAMKKKDI